MQPSLNDFAALTVSFRTTANDGTIFWQNEKEQLHRIDGPAVEFPSGYKHWYQNGLRHRTDGPAVVVMGKGESWYVNDKPIDVKPILERLDISPDWKSWTDVEKMIVRLALP